MKIKFKRDKIEKGQNEQHRGCDLKIFDNYMAHFVPYFQIPGLSQLTMYYLVTQNLAKYNKKEFENTYSCQFEE